MNRRTFLLTPAVAASALEAQKRPAAKPAALAADPNKRAVEMERIYPLNRNWRFSREATAGFSAPAFNDSKWDRVTLPHTNVVLPWHGFDEKDSQFVSAYRRHFAAPAGWKGKRVFVDFGGAMTAAKVSINGHEFPEYKGGYTPFSFELTEFLKLGADNLLAVEVDSTERKDIPPFGDNVDYLTFGGIYRDVELRVVPQTYIENVYAKPVFVGAEATAVVRVYLSGKGDANATIVVELRDGERVVKRATRLVNAPREMHEITLQSLGPIERWDLKTPKMYTVAVELTNADQSKDEYSTRMGFREAKFTPKGFSLNGQIVKLRGLNRHQTFPFVGGAMPARVQARDAHILKNELHCNIVRTSHYPQSPAFLDACDDLGLLVFTETPGWQFIGDKPWQDIVVRNVGEMIRRDWNHPSIILWGVRVNESQDNHDLYVRTNALAHQLDDGRQTGGVRYNYQSELLEDVFTMNDFGFPLRPPNHPLYLNTEFSGHMFSTKRFDNVVRVAEHVGRHARVHNTLAGDARYAGGLGWCAFDYNTHSNFGSGDHICYHGVSDIFRIPKPAAYFYKSQIDPEEEVVLEAGFFWSSGDRSAGEGVGQVPVLSNCDHLKIYYAGKLKEELDPDRKTYPNLKYPPFTANLDKIPLSPWGDVKIEGYIKGRLVKTLLLPGTGKDVELKVLPDDTELVADGRDATRVVLMVTDEAGNIRPFANSAVAMTLTGPGELIGENPFGLAGGTGAVWIKAREAAGTIRLTTKHPYLGSKTIEVRVKPAPLESV